MVKAYTNRKLISESWGEIYLYISPILKVFGRGTRMQPAGVNPTGRPAWELP